MSSGRLGPYQSATLIVKNLSACLPAYAELLGTTVIAQGQVNDELANGLNQPALLGRAVVTLAAADGSPLLRLIECVDAAWREPFRQHGWMALEIAVGDVYALRKAGIPDYFRVIGEPQALALSDNIHAMQVAGKNGEVLYLTQVKGPVPPFELPVITEQSGPLFISVLCAGSRARSVEFYQQLHQGKHALCFDTYVGVLNRTYDKPDSHQYPLATLQFNGDSLIEIDEVAEAKPANASLSTGIICISWHVQTLPADSLLWGVSQGPDGEYLELLPLVESA